MSRFSVVFMPLNQNGDGPASSGEAVYDTWEVWDLDFRTVCSCFSEDHARDIVQVLNREPLYEGNVEDFDK